MQSIRTALESVFQNVSVNLNIYVTIICVFSYHAVLEREFVCSCSQQDMDCGFYMFLPCLIIMFAMLWMDKLCQRAWRYSCSNCHGRFCCVLWCYLLKAACVGLLWVASVLVEGSWYKCCRNTENPHLSCKTANFTTDESAIVANLLNESRVYGFLCILCITFVGAFFSALQPCKSHHKQSLFDILVVKQEEVLVSNALNKAVEDKMTKMLNTYVQHREWGKCFNIADELLEDEWSQEQRGVPAEGQELEPMKRPEGPESEQGSSTE